MKKIITTALSIFLLANLVIAQDYMLNYDWESSPNVHEMTERESKESEVYIKHAVGAEIFYTDEGSPIEYYMRHVIIHLNDADAVDSYNKVYMPGSMADEDEYTIVEKARVIKKNGKTVELDAADIMVETNEEEGSTYRYFALEGLEVGDEVEYFYVYPRSPELYGNFYKLQSGSFKREASITIITPLNLQNRFHSLNGFPVMKRDSSQDDVNFYSATAHNLEPLNDEEAFAAYQASRGGVAYYLYKNTYNDKTFDFYSLVSKFHARIYDDIDLKKTGINKLIKSMKIDKDLSDEEKIIFVENYVKKNYAYIKEGISGLSDVKNIIKKGYGNELGLTKLYMGIFKALEIEYQMVNTCDRDDFQFMADFKCQLFIQETMFYFPDTKKFMAPVGLNNRYGYPPPHFTDNKGLFTRFISLGDGSAGVGKVKMIKPLPADQSMDEFEIKVTFDDLPTANVHIDRTLSGYDALNYQPFFELVDEENRVELEESLVNYFDEDMEIDKIDLSDIDIATFGEKPMRVEADFTSQAFVKKAGKNYLLNIGELIGPQSNLYQEGDRQMAVSNRFNRGYKRTIVVNIPDGYELANLEKLNFNIAYDDNGKKDMGFVSSYKVEGNTLTVVVEEYYNTISYPIERYPDFEKVINAAADFNKVAVLMKKKS